MTIPAYVNNTFVIERKTVTDRYNLPVFETAIYQRVALSACVNNEIDLGNLRIPDPKSTFQYRKGDDSAKEFFLLCNEVSEKIGLQ